VFLPVGGFGGAIERRSARDINFQSSKFNMRNFLKTAGLLALVLLGALLTPTPARAQRGFDLFGGTRTLQVWQPTVLNFVGGPTFTNDGTAGGARGIVDTRLFTGTALLSISSFTNAGGSLTVQPYGSPDATNWTALANWAVISNTVTVVYTNTYYSPQGTNVQIADKWLVPGTFTAPTAATAGFATTYLSPSTPFTNAAAIDITAKAIYLIGLNMDDCPRYLQLWFTPTGSSSNDVVSAALTGFVHREVRE
jgi:hypothetical protein